MWNQTKFKMTSDVSLIALRFNDELWVDSHKYLQGFSILVFHFIQARGMLSDKGPLSPVSPYAQGIAFGIRQNSTRI